MSVQKDRLIRGTALDGKVRIVAVRSTGIVEEMKNRHDMWPTAAAAFGRTVTAGAMMAAMLKGEEKLTIQVQGDGPVGKIMVDANAVGDVRGYVDHPHVDLPANQDGKFDVAGAVGTTGMIYIIKDLNMKEPYRGSTPIISGELGEDFTYYFAKSEQTPSVVALGVLINPDTTIRVAGGFILQLLPGATDEQIDEIERHIAHFSSITSLLDQGLELEQIVAEIVPSFQVLSEQDVRFRCKCSKDRVKQVLISMGKAEIEAIRKEDGKAEVICQFCNEAYTFHDQDLAELLA